MQLESRLARFVVSQRADAVPADALRTTRLVLMAASSTGVAGAGEDGIAALRRGLADAQTLNALGLAFNRCGGSFQSNIDGTLAVQLIEGWVAQAGVECAQMAQRGLTGPVNFLEGVYGYPQLFGRGRLEPASVVASKNWR